MLKKPSHLKPGDTIAAIAPAFSFEPELFAQGRAQVEKNNGVKIVSLDSVHDKMNYFAGSDKRRLDEFYQWLTDPNVAALIGIRGGYGCSRFYPELLKNLRSNSTLQPKIVMGYSDLTIILNGLYQDLGWATFHGPLFAGRAMRQPSTLESDTFRRALFTADPLGAVRGEKTAILHPGSNQGRIVGGCLSLIVASIGTPYEINTKDAVLFIEDVDERPFRIDRMMTQLKHAGLLDHIRGLVIGQMYACKPYPENKDPDCTSAVEAIKLAVGDHLKKKKIPAIFDFPAGHGAEQITFPLGVQVEIHAEGAEPKLVFLESGTA